MSNNRLAKLAKKVHIPKLGVQNVAPYLYHDFYPQHKTMPQMVTGYHKSNNETFDTNFKTKAVLSIFVEFGQCGAAVVRLNQSGADVVSNEHRQLFKYVIELVSCKIWVQRGIYVYV